MDNWIIKQAQLAPNRVAVTDGERQLTFAELMVDATHVAGQLQVAGVGSGQSVALLANNSLDAYRIAMALFATGRPIVWLNKRLTVEEQLRQIKDSGSVSVIVEDDLWQEAFSSKGVTFSKLLAVEADDGGLVEDFQLGDTASVMYTSGTTGQPKGVIQTVGNHYNSAIASALNLGLTSHDEWLCAVPIFHISGFSIMMRGLIYGMTVRLTARFDAQVVHTILVHEPVTMISVVPFMLKKLLAIQERAQTPYNVKFRGMLLGGGPIDALTLDRCKRLHIAVVQSYGMTETASQIVALNYEDAAAHIGSVGKPLFLTQLKLRSAGEILLKTPALSPGYLGRPEAMAAKTTTAGWYQTGDIGHVDEAGFLYVDGRVDDMIISGGENIFPDEVEVVYQGSDKLSEISVVGEADEQWGMVPVAFVVANQPIDSAALREFGRAHLAHYKVPRRFIQVTALPKNASGKIQRHKLRTQLVNNLR